MKRLVRNDLNSLTHSEGFAVTRKACRRGRAARRISQEYSVIEWTWIFDVIDWIHAVIWIVYTLATVSATLSSLCFPLCSYLRLTITSRGEVLRPTPSTKTSDGSAPTLR